MILGLKHVEAILNTKECHVCASVDVLIKRLYTMQRATVQIENNVQIRTPGSWVPNFVRRYFIFLDPHHENSLRRHNGSCSFEVATGILANLSFPEH